MPHYVKNHLLLQTNYRFIVFTLMTDKRNVIVTDKMRIQTLRKLGVVDKSVTRNITINDQPRTLAAC